MERIDAGRFAFAAHALTSHSIAEGFTPRQALAALRAGHPIERRDDHRRCLICGACPDLLALPDFIGPYIHCVVSWDAPAGIVIVTMYRPRRDRWLTEETRRGQRDEEERR